MRLCQLCYCAAGLWGIKKLDTMELRRRDWGLDAKLRGRVGWMMTNCIQTLGCDKDTSYGLRFGLKANWWCPKIILICDMRGSLYFLATVNCCLSQAERKAAKKWAQTPFLLFGESFFFKIAHFHIPLEAPFQESRAVTHLVKGGLTFEKLHSHAHPSPTDQSVSQAWHSSIRNQSIPRMNSVLSLHWGAGCD